jgi:corrinoid protein of di/trimethylamine methyltransferase
MKEKEQTLLEALQQAVIQGDVGKTDHLAKAAIEQGVDPLLALEEGLGKGIRMVGDAFGKEELFLPELIIAADALKAGTSILAAELKKRGVERKKIGTVVIGTASGDIHDIGKTIVATMLTANGFEVYDLGVDVSPEMFVAAVQQHNANIVGISSLLTTSMINQPEVIKALIEANLRDQVKVIVGGGPLSAEWAEQIGADGYGVNAAEAVEKARALLSLDV